MLVWSQNNCCLFLPIFSFHGSGCTRCAIIFALHVPAKTAPTRTWLGRSRACSSFNTTDGPYWFRPWSWTSSTYYIPCWISRHCCFFSLLEVFECWPAAPVLWWCVNNVISLSAIHRVIPKDAICSIRIWTPFPLFSQQTPYYSCPKKVYTRASSLFDQSLICTMWSLRFFFVKHPVHHFIVIWFLRRHSIYLQKKKISRK